MGGVGLNKETLLNMVKTTVIQKLQTRQTRTCGRFEVGLLLLLDGLRVVVGGAFVHGQGGDLLVRLSTVVTVVRLAGCVDHMVFVEAGVLSETLLTARHRAHVWLLAWGVGDSDNVERN